MKNKGFTLIETLAVITILSIIGVIIVLRVGDSIGTAKNSLNSEQINNIILATRKYVTENPDLLPEIEGNYDSIVTIDELIENGIIENDRIIDPKTKEQINGCILITYNQDNNQYEYEYSTEICNIKEGTQFKFDYTGGEQTFNALRTGYYKLEVWGAQGGTGNSLNVSGGYGGYSTGDIILNKNEKIYINVGQMGSNDNSNAYNGGGAGNGSLYSGDGGGATHIAKESGVLSTLSEKKDSILIVSGGGGGTSQIGNQGGYAGGFKGVKGNGNYGAEGGSQIAGGSTYNNNINYAGLFGQGGNAFALKSCSSSRYFAGGGGGGYYGGGGGDWTCTASSSYSGAGGGGSGYIGNTYLKNKSMYCYGCEESKENETKTISTTGTSTERDTTKCPNGYSNNPVSKCAKEGNGYVIITYLGKINEETENNEKNFDYTGTEQIFTAPKIGYYKLETWGAQGGNSRCDGSICGNPGYGGYSIGYIFLRSKDVLYVNVGGQGSDGIKNSNAPGGYNGGGFGTSDGENGSGYEASGGGGGATHIATKSGLLLTLENFEKQIIIVSGGGGGSSYNYAGGSGGGIKGGTADSNTLSGTQTSGYAFGRGQDGSGIADSDGVAGGGAGYYGGYMNNQKYKSSGSGGSGYIGNTNLKNKSMYCYDCEESNEESTKTISTTGTSTERDTTNCPNGYSETPISKCAKSKNGFVRITYLGRNLN